VFKTVFDASQLGAPSFILIQNRLIQNRPDWMPLAVGIVIFVTVVGYLLYFQFSRRDR
jgi:hypothetical protein